MRGGYPTNGGFKISTHPVKIGGLNGPTRWAQPVLPSLSHTYVRHCLRVWWVEEWRALGAWGGKYREKYIKFSHFFLKEHSFRE